jgi:hypothetical protein
MRYDADPPAASGRKLEGQVETNEAAQGQFADLESVSADDADPLRRAAYAFGWQSFLQYGRSPSTAPTPFDAVEPTLRRDWDQLQSSGVHREDWEAAREIVQDAWNKVQDAMSGNE